MARMSEFTFLSSDGQTALSAREYLPEGDSAGIVQIVHGIAEHIARYDAFASFLAEHGFIVVMHDQLGHGKSAPDEAHLGFFSEENGWEKAVQDIRSLHDKTAAKYPGKPLSDKLAFVAITESVSRLMSQKKLAEANSEAGKLEEDIESYLKDIEKNGR